MRKQPKARTTKSKSRIDDFKEIKQRAQQRRVEHEVQLELNMERLGTKIVEEPFTKQFIGLVSSPQIDWVKGVAPSKDNEIQAITGATISSVAVVDIINAGIAKVREGGSK